MSVIILNVEPGGCRSSRPIPATARICPVAGTIATTPPSWPAERGHGRALHRRRHGRAHGARRLRGRGREHPCARTRPRTRLTVFGEQFSARCAAQARVERQLQSAHADGRVRGHAFGLQFVQARRRDRADRADDRARERAERRGALTGFRGRAFGEHRPVSRQQRGPAGQGRVARQPLAGAQARERERARPGDPRAGAAALHRQREVAGERPEQARLHPHRHFHPTAAASAAGLADHARAGRGGGRGRERAAVVPREPLGVTSRRASASMSAYMLA